MDRWAAFVIGPCVLRNTPPSRRKRTPPVPKTVCRRRSRNATLPPNGRSVHGECGGPVLNVEAAHLGLVIEVVVRHVRVAGRRRDHDEPERGPGERRGRPAVDVMRHCEPGGVVDVRSVDLDGGQVVEVEGDRGFTRSGLGLKDDSVDGRHVAVHRWSDSGGTRANRDIVQAQLELLLCTAEVRDLRPWAGGAVAWATS